MTLGQKQRLFSVLLGTLIGQATSLGWLISLSEGYVGDSINRPEEDSPHRRDGGHFKRIAQDVNLYHCPHVPVHLPPGLDSDGCPDPVWHRDTVSYQVLGAFWERQHPLARWGGRWGDGNHFSLEDAGVKLIGDDPWGPQA